MIADTESCTLLQYNLPKVTKVSPINQFTRNTKSIIPINGGLTSFNNKMQNATDAESTVEVKVHIRAMIVNVERRLFSEFGH